jgi:hypothetical protein
VGETNRLVRIEVRKLKIKYQQRPPFHICARSNVIAVALFKLSEPTHIVEFLEDVLTVVITNVLNI